jgi:RimJ/RimL family protein N-acetyltransferase
VGAPWRSPVTLAGEHVRLEALGQQHADGLLTAGADPRVWRYLWARQPRTAQEMSALIAGQLSGDRVCWAQIDARTGAPIGMTTYYEVSERDRHVAIGGTWIGSPWWRTGVNTEAKLMLLRRAFGDLGAIRVTWHTDIRNERSQAAIARLGAVREGVLRAHRIRPDGSLRDSVVYSMTAAEWPAAEARLTATLTAAG